MSILNQGGPIFMYPLLIILILVVALIVKGFLNKDSSTKTISLINSISLFALFLGFLAQIIALIGAFDAIELRGGITTRILAAGLKISFLAPAFGIIIFLVARLGIIFLTLLKKQRI
jgi:hypothetical protein